MSADLRPVRPASARPTSKRALGGGSSIVVVLRRPPDVEIVEGHVGLPVVDREVYVRRTAERVGIGPGQKRTSVDGPVDSPALAGDGEVVVLAWLDLDVVPLGLAPGAVFLQPADDRQAVV